mgnify:CR=1 FL=1
MNISCRCEYACRAMVELARVEKTGEPVPAPDIADRQHIPGKYLVHILLQLKRAGLVRSVRGSQGGYILARPPERITLHDIVRAIDGPVLEPLPVNDSHDEELAPTWRTAAAGIVNVLEGITLQSILDRLGGAPMFHI